MEKKTVSAFSGQTALITGASSGIGYEYARAFASKGSNLILVARRADALKALASELMQQFGVTVSTIALDLAKQDSGEKLVAKIGKTHIDILINNAGFGSNTRFENANRDRIREEITLNTITLTDLTAAYLPAMVSKKVGLIINIASTAAYQPVPGMAVYAATKSYVLSFTEALWFETQGTGVRVLAVCPGATETEFFKIAGSSPSRKLAPIASVIEETFRALDSDSPSVVVGRMNRFMASSSKLAPKKVVLKIAASMFLPKRTQSSKK